MLSCKLTRQGICIRHTRQLSWDKIRALENILKKDVVSYSKSIPEFKNKIEQLSRDKVCALVKILRNDNILDIKNTSETKNNQMMPNQDLLHMKIKSKLYSLFQKKTARLPILFSTGLAINLDSKPDSSLESSLNNTEVQSFIVDKNLTESTAQSVVNSTSLNDTEKVEGLAESVKVDVLENLPEPPAALDFSEIATETLQQLNILGQPTFASLGLGGNSPVGLIQTCFEYLNVSCGIPWWGAICIGTLVIRVCMFPLVVIAQRNAAKMNNNMPQMQAIQMRITEARQTGNQLEAARYSQEMMLFMKEKQLNPLKNMVVPLCQMPVFISFFMALRQMSNVPVESLKTGGLWWFTDLTLPDQFFIMPIVTSLTLWATIELGTDSAKLSAQNLQTMKYVLRALPVCILPFIVNFPGAILVYWTASNFISLAQVGILKIPAVREYCKIEKTVTFDPKTLPIKPKGFTEGLKDSWTNMKIVNELEERKRLDDMQFRRAGKGPIVKTYKYDPTKQSTPLSASAIRAKKQD